MVECSYCPKKPRKATQFMVSPGGAHIPLCNSCFRQMKAQAAKTRAQLQKSGDIKKIDPELKRWIQNPTVVTSSDEYLKQQAERDGS